MTTSTIPTFLSTLLTQAQAVAGNTTLGPPTSHEESTGLYIGVDTEGAAPIEFDQDWAGSGSGARDEVYRVPCLLFGRTGDNNPDAVAALLTSTMGTFEAVAALFRPLANFGIEGKTFRAYISSGSLTLLPRSTGLLARVSFTVTCSARI